MCLCVCIVCIHALCMYASHLCIRTSEIINSIYIGFLFTLEEPVLLDKMLYSQFTVRCCIISRVLARFSVCIFYMRNTKQFIHIFSVCE